MSELCQPQFFTIHVNFFVYHETIYGMMYGYPVTIHAILAIHFGQSNERTNNYELFVHTYDTVSLKHIIYHFEIFHYCSGVVRVEEEFQRLGRSVSPPAQYKTANLNCNKQKNRYANVLPFDDSRVKLTQIPGIEGSDYINANFIDGYMKKKAFIATQAPIPDTIPDFWRMIWQENSFTIVMISNEMESGRVS